MSSQNRENQKGKLRTLLLTCDSADKMLKIFKKMEESRCFTQDELDLYCTPIADKLYLQGKDLEKTLFFAKKSLKGMLSELGKSNKAKIHCIVDEKIGLSCITVVLFGVDGSITRRTSTSNHHYVMDLSMPMILLLLGTISGELGRYNESFSYFSWADRNLTKLVEKDCAFGCFMRKLEIANRGMFAANRSMGRLQEAIPHVKKMFECKEKRLEEGCVEIGEASKDVYRAYFADHKFKEALPFCLKALEIHRKHFGGESAEVAKMAWDLGTIYGGLGEYEKSVEQNELAKSILKKVAPDSVDLVELELEDGSTLSGLGRYKEAFEVYKAVLSHAGARETDRARAFGGMAHASLNLNKFADTKKYIRAAERIFANKGMDPLFAAVGFEHHSRMYEQMDDLETAISLLRRVLEVAKLPEWLLVKASSKLFLLYYCLADKRKEGIPNMEDAVEKLKERFGPDHYQVGRGYGMVGQVYMMLAQYELGVKFLEQAKEILGASRGPDHEESLQINHHLALCYSSMRRVKLAIENEERVVAGCRVLGPSGQKLMGDAVELLNKLKVAEQIEGVEP